MMDKKEEETLQPKKTMEDLPPEVVTIILEHLTRTKTKKVILGYRLVNSQWKDIIGSLLEKKIISGHFKAFPQVRVSRRKSKMQLPIDQSFGVFPAGHNPFPFNSLVLCHLGARTDGDYYPYRCTVADIRRMVVPEMMFRFGGYLTFLSLHKLKVCGMDFLTSLLNPLTSLKVLCIDGLCFDRGINMESLVFSTPPSLPSLTSLEVKCEWVWGPAGRNEPGQLALREIIPYWLIASYADQLLELKLGTYPLDTALQRRLQYYYTLPNGKILPITATSDSAFENLRELTIQSPPRKRFLHLSEFPKLQRLCVASWDGNNHLDIQDLVNFISKCGKTLHKLELGVNGKTLIGQEAIHHYEREGTLPPLIVATPPPKLKTLEILYSRTDDRSEDTMISRVLTLFPTLKTLHFLCFPYDCFTTAKELETVDLGLGSGNLADQIVTAKTRLATLQQELYEATMRFYRQRAAIPPLPMSDLYREMNHLKMATNVEKAEIFKGLAALGVKKQDVVVELFLERLRIWNTCPNLKVVSFSLGNKPTGNVCILQRPETL